MKRLFVLQFLLCLLFAKPVGAYDFYLENGEGDVIYLNDVTMYEFMPQVEVVGGAMSDDGEITIPAKYGKYDIVGISSYAFRSFSSLKKIVLPESLQYIHKGAFESCRALETVVLPEGLFEISSDAFKMCYALKEIRITSSLVSTNAFDYCMNLEKITFAPNVRDVASWAFTNCNKIKTLIFEDGDGELFLGYGGNNNEMTYGLFYGLKLDSIYLGRGLNYNATSIKQLPFYGTGIERPKLEAKASVIPPYWYEGLDADEFVVPENVKIIANNAFEYSNIKKIIFNERLETIGANAFKSSNLGEIVQPEVNNLKEIGEYAFQGCRFQKFKLPVGFTEIKPNSFQSCSMLEEMDIPHTVTRIGGYAFYGCHRLNFSGLSENLDSLGAYAFAGTAIESISIPIGVEYIHSGVFNNCDKLVNIELHNGIIGIGSKAFEGCDALESIKIPNNITEFSERVFQGCTKLKEINVPENLKYIRRNAFDGCKSLLSIELPKQLYELGDYSFRGCGFVSFTFPEKINYLRVGVLQNCKALKSVNFPTVKSDDLGYSLNGTFAGCSSLESITIPQSIKVINENVFEGCTSLKSIRIENSTETMFLYSSDSPDIQLFGDCILKNVYIGRNVGGSATINSSNCSSTPFYGQIKIDTVELGGYMGEISSWLFPNCKIKKLYINDVIKSIKANAFYSTIPDTVVCQGIEPPSMDLGGLADALIYVPNGTGIDYRRYESWNQNLIIDLTDTISTVRVRYPGAIIASFKQSGIMAPGNVTKVRIEGKINDSDWKVLKDDLRHIYYMDLSATIIDSIPSNQFRGDCKINNIILPSSIKKIGNNAFNGCNNLQLEKLYLENCEYVGCGAFANSFIKNYIFNKAVVIGDSAFAKSKISTIDFRCGSQIGKKAFENCTNLSTIIFAGRSSIDKEAFRNCVSLTSVALPELDNSLGNCAFYGCTNLSDVKFPQKGFDLGDYSFYDCINIKTVSVVGEGYSIGSYAFANTGIKTLVLGDAVNKIGEFAFSNCFNLKGKVSLPSSLKKIEKGLFKNCSLIENISLKDSIVSIGAEAFAGCTSLRNINLSKLLKKIEPEAFSNCNIDELDIPFGLGDFSGAFKSCNIKNLRTHWQIPVLVDETTFEGLDEDNCILTVPANSAMYYLTTDVWKKFWNIEEIVDETVGKIKFKDPVAKELCINKWDVSNDGELGFDEALRVDSLGNVFADNKELVSFEELVNFTQLKVIDSYSFAGCSNLKSVVIPESVTKITPLAFQDCSSLSHISVDSANVVYDSRNNCNAIIISETNHLLRGCNNTVIPNTVTYIDEYAFKNCMILSCINIPKLVKGIGYGAFEGCINLDTLKINNKEVLITKNDKGISSIFGNNVSSVVLEDINEIPAGAFRGMTSLNNVVMPDSIYKIGRYAFEGCTGLDSIYLSRGLTEIGNYAFKGAGINFLNMPCCYIGDGALTSNINSLTIEKNYLTGCDTLNFNEHKVMPITLNIKCNYVGGYFGNNRTKSITIGSDDDNVKISIRQSAFEGCSALKDLYLGQNVIDIGDRAFYGCTSLDSLILPSNIKVIQDSVFMNCTSLSMVEMPNSITKIGKSAFRNCTSLNSLYLSRGLELIDEYAFNGSLLSKLNMPCCNSGDNAFTGCTIRYLTIEKNPITGCDSIPFFHADIQRLVSLSLINCKLPDNHIFWYNNSLNTVTIGNDYSGESSEVVIPTNAFKGCDNLQSVYLGTNVKSIGDNAFSYCRSLKSITLTNGLEKIGKSVFDNTALDTIRIPQTVVTMHPIYGIDHVYVQWKEPIYVDGNSDTSRALHVPAGTTAKYKSAPYWKDFKIVEIITPGDVNNDSVVNVTDAIGIVNYILKNTPATFIETAADVNEDGTINVTDAIGVVNKILNIDSGAKFYYVREKSFVEPQ